MAALTGFIRERDLAEQLGISLSGLRAWKRRGYGPKPGKIGKLVVYSKAEVNLFVASVFGDGSNE